MVFLEKKLVEQKCGMHLMQAQKGIHEKNSRRSRPHVAGYFRKRRLFSPNTATVHT